MNRSEPPSLDNSVLSVNSHTQSDIRTDADQSLVEENATNYHQLKFVERISPEHILIGNEKQVDLINISGITSSGFVDTEFLWSLNFREDIHLISVDNKSKSQIMLRIQFACNFDRLSANHL